MTERTYEIPTETLIKRVQKKRKQLEQEFAKDKPDWHSLNHLASDLSTAIRGINERTKKL